MAAAATFAAAKGGAAGVRAPALADLCPPYLVLLPVATCCLLPLSLQATADHPRHTPPPAGGWEKVAAGGFVRPPAGGGSPLRSPSSVRGLDPFAAPWYPSRPPPAPQGPHGWPPLTVGGSPWPPLLASPGHQWAAKGAGMSCLLPFTPPPPTRDVGRAPPVRQLPSCELSANGGGGVPPPPCTSLSLVEAGPPSPCPPLPPATSQGPAASPPLPCPSASLPSTGGGCGQEGGDSGRRPEEVAEVGVVVAARGGEGGGAAVAGPAKGTPGQWPPSCQRIGRGRKHSRGASRTLRRKAAVHATTVAPVTDDAAAAHRPQVSRRAIASALAHRRRRPSAAALPGAAPSSMFAYVLVVCVLLWCMGMQSAL